MEAFSGSRKDSSVVCCCDPTTMCDLTGLEIVAEFFQMVDILGAATGLLAHTRSKSAE